MPPSAEWHVYDGRFGRPKAAVLRCGCSCGWRGMAEYPLDWATLPDDKPLYEADVGLSGPVADAAHLSTFRLSTDPLFIDRVRDVVGLYLDPPEKALVLCVDEKSQIQALDRSQPVLPMMPGVPERRSHDYIRAGTTTLFAALETCTRGLLQTAVGRPHLVVVASQRPHQRQVEADRRSGPTTEAEPIGTGPRGQHAQPGLGEGGFDQFPSAGPVTDTDPLPQPLPPRLDTVAKTVDRVPQDRPGGGWGLL